MNVLKEYIDYIKDNPEHYWFKAKLYGWGWTPATVEGWFVMVVYCALILGNFYRIDRVSHPASDTLQPLLAETVFLTGILILVCWRTGERPHWQGGIPKKKK